MSAILIFIFSFGAIIGSFLNVLIHRLPLDQDVVWKRSHCPNCSKIIHWYENIPIFSYLFLRGKCSGCNSKIAIRYPFVEVLSALMAVILFPRNISIESILYFIFYFSIIACFIVHFFVDLKHQILPDSITIYLSLLFLSFSIWHHHWQFWLLGAIVGIMVPSLVTYLFYLLKGQIGMGMGDIKLYGSLGIFLGPLGILNTIVISSLLGALVGIILIASKIITKDRPIPFGPFIIISSIFQIFFPNIVKQIPLLF